MHFEQHHNFQFSSSHLKKKVETGRIYFNNIFYLTQYIQSCIFQCAINVNINGNFTFDFSCQVFEIYSFTLAHLNSN